MYKESECDKEYLKHKREGYDLIHHNIKMYSQTRFWQCNLNHYLLCRPNMSMLAIRGDRISPTV